MRKTIISLTETQMEALSREAKKKEISKSELLRRFLDRQLELKGEILDEKDSTSSLKK